jgi:hypothetical protein
MAAEAALRVETYPIVGDRIHKHLLAVGVRYLRIMCNWHLAQGEHHIPD